MAVKAVNKKTSADNLECLRTVLSVNTLLEEINQEEALEFLEAVEHERTELHSELKELEDLIEQQSDVDKLITKLSTEKLTSDQIDDLLKVIEDEDPDPIYDFVKDKGFCYIRIETMDQQEKLRAFVESEIWPHYNEQASNILF